MLVLYIILFIASFFFYILYEGVFSFYLFAFLFITPIVLFVIQKIQAKNISVKFSSVNQTASKSTKIPVVLKIENTSLFPVANMIIEIEYYNTLENKKNVMKINTPVYANDMQFLTLHISGKHYGTIKMKIKRAKIVDMLKLTKVKIKYSEAENIFKESTFSIVPDYIQIENNIANYSEMGLDSDDFSKTSKGDDPSEIFDIHEYVEGDKISRIHWKLSAKSDKTMVKDYSLPISNSIVILLDLNLNTSDSNYLQLYDAMIETVSTISEYLIINETPHKVMWFDNEKNDFIMHSITNEETHNFLVSRLIQTSLYNESDLTLINYISEIQRGKCGHLMYFSANYKDSVSATMNDNDLAFRYTYMYVTKDNNKINLSDEFAQVIQITPNHIAQSIQDMCL